MGLLARKGLLARLPLLRTNKWRRSILSRCLKPVFVFSLWATGRLFGKNILFITLGVANGVFVDVHVDVKGLARSGESMWKADVIEGKGFWRSALGSEWIEASNVTFVRLKKSHP
eukprot:1598589-Rhodomonas_salina.5